MAKNKFSKLNTLLPKFLLGEEKRFRSAVRVVIEEMEKDTLLTAVKHLQKLTGERIWKTGYDFDKVELIGDTFDFDNELGIRLSLDLNHIPPTVRQFCYQFVRLAEIEAEEIDYLEQKIKQLELPFYIKLWRWLRKTRTA